MEYVPDIDQYGQHDAGDFCLGLYLTFVIAFFGAGFALCATVFNIRIFVLRHKIHQSKRKIEENGGDASRQALIEEKRDEEER